MPNDPALVAILQEIVALRQTVSTGFAVLQAGLTGLTETVDVLRDDVQALLQISDTEPDGPSPLVTLAEAVKQVGETVEALAEGQREILERLRGGH